MTRLPQSGSDEGAWGDLLNSYLRTEHNADGTHNISAILQLPVTPGLSMVSSTTSGKGFAWRTLTRNDVGLSNVDNTADADKPISAATVTALALKADTGDALALALAL